MNTKALSKHWLWKQGQGLTHVFMHAKGLKSKGRHEAPLLNFKQLLLKCLMQQEFRHQRVQLLLSVPKHYPHDNHRGTLI